MTTPTLAQQISEAKQAVRDHQTAASKPGKAQSLAQLRLDAAQAILNTLEFVLQHRAAIIDATKPTPGTTP